MNQRDKEARLAQVQEYLEDLRAYFDGDPETDVYPHDPDSKDTARRDLMRLQEEEQMLLEAMK